MSSYKKDDTPTTKANGIKAEKGKLPSNFAGIASRQAKLSNGIIKKAEAIEDYRKELSGIDADEFMKDIADDLWPEKS